MNSLVKKLSSQTLLPLSWPARASVVAEDEPSFSSLWPVWSDEQLVQRLGAGEPDALGLIYDRYAGALYRLLNALLGSPADAEDALQEVFIALTTARVSRIRHLKSYLFVAARHQAFTILRRRKREGYIEDVSALDIADPQSLAVENGDSVQDWAALLARLPIEQREVIALKVWEEMTFADIAEVVRASPNTVMSRYRYGIERLRKWCQEQENDLD